MTRYADVQQVLRHPEVYSSNPRFTQRVRSAQTSAGSRLRMLWRVATQLRMNPFKLAGFRMLILDDPPSHGGMRALVNKGFTPRQIAHWDGRIRELVAKSMTEIQTAERFDLVSALANVGERSCEMATSGNYRLCQFPPGPP